MTEQGFSSFDPQTAKLYNFIMDKNLDLMRQVVARCYSDFQLLGDYEALRNAYAVEDWKNKSNSREMYRPPHPIVHRFIDAEMTKKYGVAWKQDKNIFRKVCKTEDLIKPWLLVPWNKI